MTNNFLPLFGWPFLQRDLLNRLQIEVWENFRLDLYVKIVYSNTGPEYNASFFQ